MVGDLPEVGVPGAEERHSQRTGFGRTSKRRDRIRRRAARADADDRVLGGDVRDVLRTEVGIVFRLVARCHDRDDLIGGEGRSAFERVELGESS